MASDGRSSDGRPLLAEGTKVRHDPDLTAAVALDLARRGRRRSSARWPSAEGSAAAGLRLVESLLRSVMSSTPVTVVILAAGLGTRMSPRQAKVLHRAGGSR